MTDYVRFAQDMGVGAARCLWEDRRSLAFCAVPACVLTALLVLWLEPYRQREVKRLEALAKATEIATCQRAGYKASHWQSDGAFYCSDKRGRMFLVTPPKCNTRGKEHDFTNACAYTP